MAILNAHFHPCNKGGFLTEQKPKKKLILREAKLAKPVANWLRRNGLTVWAEVPWFDTAVDLVGWNEDKGKGKRIVMVELKTCLSKQVINQTRLHMVTTPYVYAAVGTTPSKKSLQQITNIGVVQVIGSRAKQIIKPKRFIHGVEAHQEYLINILCHMKPSDEGGLPNKSGVGPAQNCYNRVQEYRKTHPKAKWPEIYNNVYNHYAHHISMQQAMRFVEQRRAKQHQ